MTRQLEETAGFPRELRHLLWIDGVGAFLVCLGDRVSIGGPALNDEGADVSLLAGLSRTHATILRMDESYLLEPHSQTSISGRMVLERTLLPDDTEFCLGENVRLKLRVPSVLSGSACLEFVSHHRPHSSVDGIVLMQDSCLIGPGTDHHIQCPNWEHSIVLFLREGEIWCKSPVPLNVEGEPLVGTGRVPGGAVVTGNEIRFRIESVQ